MSPHTTAPGVQVSHCGNTAHLLCPEELVRGKEQLLLTAAICETEKYNLQLDMSQVRSMDAAGLGALLKIHHFAERSGTRLELVAPAPRVLELLALTRLDSVLHVAKDKSHLTAA